jgi:hypothetical protein
MPLKLNYHVSIRNIRGEKDDGIANCYGKNCKNIKNAQLRVICNEECHQTILNNAISKLSGVVSKCNYADNPSPCRRAVARMIKIYQNRIEVSNGRKRDAKAEILAANAIKRRK